MRPCQSALKCLLLLVFVLSSQFPVKAVESGDPIGDKWAVVIGIGEFADPNTPRLKYAAKDAQDFYNFLVDPKRGRFAKDHVRLLLNQNATKVNILDALGDQFLPFAAMPDDLVVIYLSTHGSPSGSDIRGVNYVVAHDTELKRLYATGINLPDLLKTIKDRVHTKRILLCLDTCYSGAGASDSGKGLVRSNIDGPEIAQGIGSLVIASSSPDQRSWESDTLRNSYFTKYLIESLSKADGMVSVNQAFETMREQVQSDVLHDKGQLQTPTLSGKFEGPNLIVGVPPRVARRAPVSAFLPPSVSAENPSVKPTAPAQIAVSTPAAAPSALNMGKSFTVLYMDYEKLPHEPPQTKGERGSLPESVRRAAAAVAAKNGAPLIVLKQIVLAGGVDVTDEVLSKLANPSTIPPAANGGSAALLNRDKVLDSWRFAQNLKSKLEADSKRLSDLVANLNAQYDSKKASGMPAADLIAWQKESQAKIDADAKAVQDHAKLMESDLEKALDAAIRAELGSRGLPIAISSLAGFNGQDITDAVVQRLNTNDLTTTKPVPTSTAFGVLDRDAVISKFPKITQAADDLKVGEERIKALVADSNKQFEAAKSSGKSAKELAALQMSLQKNIDDEVARFKRGITNTEEVLEGDLLKVINSAAREKGVQTVLQKELVYFGGVDLTQTALKYVK